MAITCHGIVPRDDGGRIARPPVRARHARCVGGEKGGVTAAVEEMGEIKFTGRFGIEGEGRPIEEGFRDGLGCPVDGTKGIFPIINMAEAGPWIPIGTGFFISNNGMFATAKHVVLDREGQPIPGLAGIQLLRDENRVIVRQATKIVVHPKSDVALGFLFDRKFADERIQTTNLCWALTRQIPPVGSKVVTFAFPNSVAVAMENGFALQFVTGVVEGTLEEHHPHGRDSVLLPGYCFRTTMNILSGASGGPVAFGDGRVFGINSTGMDGEAVSYVSSIEGLLELDVLNVQLPGDGAGRERVPVLELVDRGLVIVR